MLMFYVAFMPLFLVVLNKRLSIFLVAIKEKRKDKIKVEMLFLSLVLIVSAFIIYCIESIG